jgi:hypothetical protein
MKIRLAMWKLKARNVALESCRKWRGNLKWKCEAGKSSDSAKLTVSDGVVTVSTKINLRIIWRAGTRRDFGYLQTITSRLMDNYYACHDARRDHTSAAAQAWDATVSPTAEKRTAV